MEEHGVENAQKSPYCGLRIYWLIFFFLWESVTQRPFLIRQVSNRHDCSSRVSSNNSRILLSVLSILFDNSFPEKITCIRRRIKIKINLERCFEHYRGSPRISPPTPSLVRRFPTISEVEAKSPEPTEDNPKNSEVFRKQIL